MITIDGTLGNQVLTVDCEIVIVNPCFDTSLLAIIPATFEPLTYVVTEQSVYKHDAFEIQTNNVYSDICGTLSYSLDAGILYTQYFTYDGTNRVFQLLTNEMAVLVQGQISYTITAYLTAFPEVHAIQTGVIKMESPCADPFLMYMGIVPNINFRYEEAVTWTYPKTLITPELCRSFATYSCTYIDGPVESDMCVQPSTIVNGVSTQISFDIQTGQYRFMSTDKQSYPEGVYTFKITATIDDKTSDFTFTMNINTNCPIGMEVFIENDPFQGPYTYMLRSEALEIPFDVSLIGNIEQTETCGGPVIEFITGAGSFDLPEIFTPDYANQKVVVGVSSVPDHAGDLYLRYKYYNSIRPEAFRVSNVFKIRIVDGCNPPSWYQSQIELVPPTFATQHYTITDPAIAYECPPWSAVPAYCAEVIPYQH